jgi:hypothetical protein
VISCVGTDHIGRPVFAINSTGVKGGTATATLATARFPGRWVQSGEPDQKPLQLSHPPANDP